MGLMNGNDGHFLYLSLWANFFAGLATYAAAFLLTVVAGFYYPLPVLVLLVVLFCVRLVFLKTQHKLESAKYPWSVPKPFEHLRTGDPILDELVQTGFFSRVNPKFDDIISLLDTTERKDLSARQIELCNQLLQQVKEVPDWVDWDKIEEARRVYKNNIILVSIGLSVALVESYGFPVDAEVLYISGGLTTTPSTTIKRLLETGIWIFGIMDHGIKFGGSGVKSILNVRLLHALARNKCIRSKLWKEKENLNLNIKDSDTTEQIIEKMMECGIESLPRIEGEIPINQATMCGTLFLFCQAVLEVAQMRGATLTAHEKECYWHFWRYVGYLLGTHESVMPESYYHGINARLSPLYNMRMNPNDKSVQLTRGTIYGYTHLPNFIFDESYFSSTIRIFLGDRISDALGVPPIGLAQRCIWCLGYALFVISSLLIRVCPPLHWINRECLFRYFRFAYRYYFEHLSYKNALSAETPRKGKCPFGF